MLGFPSDHVLFAAILDGFPPTSESGRSAIVALWPIVCVDFFPAVPERPLNWLGASRSPIGTRWQMIIQRTVRPILIILAAPIFDDDLSFGQL